MACEEKGAPIRRKIEQWAAHLPSQTLRQVIDRLLNPRFYEATLGEIVTMFCLRSHGLSFCYEKELENQTPDIYVHKNALNPAFIVEVYSEGLPEEEQKEAIWQREFEDRIRAIKLDRAVEIEYRDFAQLQTAKKRKGAAKALEDWLSKSLPTGAAFRTHGVEFKLWRTPRRRTTVQIAASMSEEGNLVDQERPRRKILTKIKKYKSLVLRQQIPFVVSYVPNSCVGTDREDIEVIAYRSPDGIFQQDDGVCSALLVIIENDGVCDVRPIFNTNARQPLDVAALPAGVVTPPA